MSSPPRDTSAWERFRSLFISAPEDTTSLERVSRGRRNSSGLLVYVNQANRTIFQQFNKRRFPSSPNDVYHVYFLLNQKLVQDLLVDIMDQAEYWLKTSTIRSDTILVHEHNAGQRYVTSAPITGIGRRPVRKVIFTIKSHDQGWSDTQLEHGGTYEASWTWFEARVVGRDGQERGADPNVLRLMQNVHGRSQQTTHTVICESKGADLQAKWIKGLRNGDSIAVVPMARFNGWVNHVESVQIECYTSALR